MDDGRKMVQEWEEREVGMILADCCSYSYSLSCKFSKPGKGGRRTRLMLVNKVALGKCKVWRVLQRR